MIKIREDNEKYLDIDVSDFTDAQFLDLQRYDVKDIDFVFDEIYFKTLLSEKLSDVAQFLQDIPVDHFLNVNSVEYDKGVRKFVVNATLQKSLIN